MNSTKAIIGAGTGSLILGLLIGYAAGAGSHKTSDIVVETVPMSSMDMNHDIHGMMAGSMDSMTANMEGKTGEELEKAFLDDMIVHHEGAVAMAELLLKGTKRPELVKLANDIITAQTGEIAQMKAWREEWFKE